MTQGSDSPPEYHILKEEATTEQNATEVNIPESHDVPETFGTLFENKDNRIGFVQKVLSIKLLQALAVTIVMVIFVGESYPFYPMMSFILSQTYRFSDARIHLIVASTLAFLITLGLLHYCTEARLTKPYNYMFLVAYPLFAAFFVVAVSYKLALDEICVSWVQFNFVVFALLIYSVLALHTNIEFKTSIGIYISAAILIITYALTVPFVRIDAFGTFYCSLLMFLLSAYMLNDLQAMMSKTYPIDLSPSDFVKAALIIHTDYRYMIIAGYWEHSS